MASSDRTAIERLTLADLPGCLALSTQAHWNQVEADWRVFFDHGLVWGIRLDGAVAASAALLPYPPATAWVSMVLTAETARGRGFASRLARAALEDCARRGLAPQLDATPEGERVYRKLGFTTTARLTRWRRAGESPPPVRSVAPPLDDRTIETICRLDARAMGFARADLLRSLSRRSSVAAVDAAFAMSRDGRTATQLGPLVADSWDAADASLAALSDRFAADRSLIIDVNDEARALAGFLDARGYRPERPFLRMTRGAAPRLDTALYLAAAGPEFG